MRDRYRPFRIGRRFFISPPDRTVPPDEQGRLPLYMERGAFGSGEHETTRSCLEVLETLPQTETRRILDFGSGTGILSIAALRLQPGRAWCVDINSLAVASARRNCALNGLEQAVTHCCGTLAHLPENGFTLILANIYGDILLDVAEELVGKAAPGAHLLLSGILWEDLFDIKKRYRQLRCTLSRSLLLDDYSTLLFIKASS